MRNSHKLLISLLIGAVVVAGALARTSQGPSAPNGSAPAATAYAPTQGADAAPANAPTTAPEPAEDAPKPGDKVAVIDTNLGRIVFEFFPGKAPLTVENFKTLARKKFYDGTKFHRVIPGFMIQGGDPNSKSDDRRSYGMGGPGYQVKAEFNDTHHERGIVSMARSQDPDSAGSQFFICVADAGFLDHQYTAFGRVVRGMDVVDKIVNLPRDRGDDPLAGNPAIMKSVRIETWPLK